MVTEDKIPIRDRVLLLEGSVSPKALEQIRAGLPSVWPATARCYLTTYSFADLPLGKRFEFAFTQHRPTQREPTVAVIHAVTQQFGKPFDAVPHGWKTVCVIDFPEGMPDLIADLPTLSGWGESKQMVGLCGQQTMEALLGESA